MDLLVWDAAEVEAAMAVDEVSVRVAAAESTAAEEAARGYGSRVPAASPVRLCSAAPPSVRFDARFYLGQYRGLSACVLQPGRAVFPSNAGTVAATRSELLRHH